jgi:F-type H+-transporting ATPase subunit delta
VTDRRVAKRYARALFATALKYDIVDSVESDLDAIVNIMRRDERFRHFLLSPEVGREEKVQIAYKLFSDRVTAVTLQALRLVLDKRRETEMETIREEFAILRRQHGEVVYVKVTTSEELPDEQRKQLEAKLQQSTGKRIEAEYAVDSKLIGGIRVAYGDYVLDGSIRGSLRRLSDVLKYDLLKQA